MLVMNLDPRTALNQAIVKETLLPQSELAQISPDFYSILNEYINQSAEKINLKSKLETLKSKRKLKLLVIAGTTIPANLIENNLATEELELFRIIRSASKTFDSSISVSQPRMVSTESMDLPSFISSE